MLKMRGNKYYEMLANILENGREQQNKKGGIRYLTNEVMRLDKGDLLDIFEGHGIARKKLKSELELFCQGERNTEAYRDAGITWWDYCGPILVNSYPTYFERLPKLVERINREKRNSKNYVLFLGETNVETNQAPCLSLVQFQIEDGRLLLTAYQRSSDASLGCRRTSTTCILSAARWSFRCTASRCSWGMSTSIRTILKKQNPCWTGKRESNLNLMYNPKKQKNEKIC